MPNRLLREGICTSDAIDVLSAEEEVFFYRLLVVSDDFGHMDGRPAILKAHCFPLKAAATIKAIELWVSGLISKGMLARYTSGGKPYLAVLKWEARVRTHPKYPLPNDADWDDPSAVCAQVADKVPQPAADGGLGLGLGKGSGAPKSNDVRFDAATGGWSVPDLLQSQWVKAYPAVNIENELSSASAWLIANPKNQKSNYARFLTNWLTRAQDKAGRAGGGVATDNRIGSFI